MLASPMVRADRYGSPLAKSPREVEYELFARITRALQIAPKGAAQAIVDNTQLWTELAADLASPGNALPDAVKGHLLSLAMFSIRHGNRVLGGKGDASVLVDINLNIMKGLRGQRAE
ncbi:flagellar biosynthesis regulator FlhF [Paracoccus aurantiacus]|uniref:Flagellar biosynthesis regulator FlhF n=1 Tax=Paracoccus aurantiacus TaxID=2599412 RepID=A0A5C6S4G4_9RHOB|nr:flagellar biosynthesis regulator FlaF [Paracoccus aurantiacus]TXB69708.1 flagellar biosynthesis regulator FlhF [Paracoccus aurantiacus]